MTASELNDRWERWLSHRVTPIVALAASVLTLVASVATTPAHDDHACWAELVPSGPRADGWSVSRPERGSEGDVVFVVRRGAEHVEVHVVPRGQWDDVVETASFGVGYEVPRTTASASDAAAVTAWFAAELRARDTGLLGSIDAIALDADAATPALARWLWSLTGMRGLAVAVAMLVLLLSLARAPSLVATALFGIGLGVRVVALDLPFARDQDVQRLLSGALPIREILFGRGLDDRHPPLWFLVLHVAELAGDAEWSARMPAVIAGALVAPAVVWAVQEARPCARVSAMTIACASVAALSPTLVGAAREVSEIPFFSLVIVSLVAMGQRARRAPTRVNLVGLALSHALVLSTSYTGVFVIAAAWVVHLASVRAPLAIERRLRAARLVGVALGLPALGLALRITLRDSGARAAAHLHPGIAWGDATPASMLAACTLSTLVAIGASFLVLAVVAGVLVRSEASRAALAIALSVALGIAALTPIARVQPYYVLAVAPLFLLALALVPPAPTWRSSLATALVVLAAALSLAAYGPTLAGLYAPDPEAVVPRYLARAREEGLERLVTVAGYDTTLVAYYAARAASRPIAWRDLDERNGWLVAPGLTPRIGSLAQSHSSDPSLGRHAAERLRAWLREGPLVVLARDAFSLPEVERILEACAVLDRSPRSRLLLCRPPDP